MVTDGELVEQTRSGQGEAYGDLFRRYQTRIYTLCLAMLKDLQEAEEVTQDVFVHAYLKLDQLQKPARFFPWLRKIAQNRARNRLERLRRSESMLAPLDMASSRTDSIAPDEQLIRQELMDAVMDAIEALPVRDRELIKARIDGLNHSEISERFGISMQASLSRLYHARKRLARHVKELLHSIFGLLRTLSFIHMKIISGGVATVKVGISAKVAVSIIGVLIAGFVGFQLGTRQSDPVKLRTERPSIAGTEQSRVSIAEKSLPSGMPSQQPPDHTMEDEAERGILDTTEEEQWEEFFAWLDSPETSSQVETPTEGETPAQILEKYMQITSSPEFQGEARDMLVASRREQGAYIKKIEELENREEELESDLETVSAVERGDIRDKLGRARDELWEAKVDLRKEAILGTDDIHRLHLRYFTLDEIRIARQEFRKTAPRPSSFHGASGEDDAAKAEAMARLKASGWVPAMPDFMY